MAIRPTPQPTGAADPENGETAPGVDGPPQTEAAAAAAAQTPATEQQAHPSAEDGRDKILSVTEIDQFGPVEIPDAKDDQGNPVTYTIPFLGVLVKGAHVEQVRKAARHAHVALRSQHPKQESTTS